MTITPPDINPVAIPSDLLTFRRVSDVVPFTYRSSMTYQRLLEELRHYLVHDFAPWVHDEFDEFGTSWSDNVTQLITTTNAALATQATNIDAALAAQRAQVAQNLADTLAAITAGESAPLFDSQVYSALHAPDSTALAFLDGRYDDRYNLLAALEAANSAALAFLDTHNDARYVRKGRVLVLNDLPGWVGDGSADMTSIINAALAGVATGAYVNAEIHPSAFGKTIVRIDGTLTIDVSKVGLTAPHGGVEFNASQMNLTNGVAMNITASANLPNNGAPGGPKLGPFRLIGPGRANTGTVGLLLSTPTLGGGSLGQIRDVIAESIHVEEFGVGHQYNNNAYCFPFINCTIKGCSIDIQMLNAGERINYISCVFSDSPTALYAHTQGGITFIDCSFDYMTSTIFDIDVETDVELSGGCHIERSMVGTDPWIRLGTTGGQFKMFGGRIVGKPNSYDPGTGPQYLIQNDAANNYTHGQVLLEGVEFSAGLQTVSGFLAGGLGTVMVRDTNRQNQYVNAFMCTSAAMNLLARGNADAGTSFADKWIVTADTAGIVSTNWTASNIAASNGSLTIQTTIKKSGTRSYRMTKTGAAGTALAFAVVVPWSRLQSIGFMGYLARHATLTGTVGVTIQFCNLLQDDTHAPSLVQPTVAVGKTVDVVNDLAAVDTWFQVSTQNHRAPAYATHAAVIFDLSAMGPGDLYLDDLCITES